MACLLSLIFRRYVYIALPQAAQLRLAALWRRGVQPMCNSSSKSGGTQKQSPRVTKLARKSFAKRVHGTLFFVAFTALIGCSRSGIEGSANPQIRQILAAEKSVELIVEFNDATPSVTVGGRDSPTVSDAAERKARYARQKVALLKALAGHEIEVTGQYEALPLMALRIRKLATLEMIQSQAAVKRIYPNQRNQAMPSNF